VVNNSLPREHSIVYTEKYYSLYEGIFAYIDEHWWENSVRNFHDLLVKKLNDLQTFPNGYPRYQETPYRRILVWDYLVLFRVDVDSGQVIVFGIYHSSQNLSEIIGDLE